MSFWMPLEGKVIEPQTPNGLISVKGGCWKAISADGNIADGGKIEIVGVDGLRPKVNRKK